MDEAEEFRRLCESLDRYLQADHEEIEADEYQRLLRRYDELRRKGHGPQPYRLPPGDLL